MAKVQDISFSIALSKVYTSAEEAAQAGVSILPKSVLVTLPDDTVVRINLDVYEHEAFDVYGTIPNTSVVANERNTGLVGAITHVTHNGKVYAVSSAHVLTQFDRNNIGKFVGQWHGGHPQDFSAGYTVGGQIDATLYPANTKPTAQQRVWGVYDFAWCVAPADVQQPACFEIPGIGFPNAPKENFDLSEEIALYSAHLADEGVIQGFVANRNTQRTLKLFDKIYYICDGFEIDVAQQGVLFSPGTSGTLVLAKNNRDIFGMVTGEGRVHNANRRVFCCRYPFPNITWG